MSNISVNELQIIRKSLNETIKRNSITEIEKTTAAPLIKKIDALIVEKAKADQTVAFGNLCK